MRLTEHSMTISSPHFIEQASGLQFDSNNFAITFASTGVIISQNQTTSMDEWVDEEESEEEDTIIEVELDPDLENSDEYSLLSDDEDGDNTSDDDEFEHYLFGEDDN